MFIIEFLYYILSEFLGEAWDYVYGKFAVFFSFIDKQGQARASK